MRRINILEIIPVWGSYYDLKTHKWGYACCQCTIFNAYCTGDDGINANKNSDRYKGITRY